MLNFITAYCVTISDTRLCDYLIYAFAKLDGNQLAPYEWNDESDEWMVGM